ncbi:zf-HC2 domain-containing protein [Sphaerobacter thermophilus]|uniref:zf-HC2 domain-containing protein n=1 Tax=Sphaerobacter thermophilus TaxID=2057 RepID=UPI0039C30117
MECRHVRSALPALIDGHLPPREAAEVQAHLAVCPACQRIERQYRQDLYDLARYLRTAPRLPIEHRPWAEQPVRRGFWGALVAGGHKLEAGTALVALLALVTVGALALRGMATRSGGDPTATAAVGAATLGEATADVSTLRGAFQPAPAIDPRFEEIMDALDQGGLVFPIDAKIDMDGHAVTLTRLAVDRTITIVEFTAPVEQSSGTITLVDQQGRELHQLYTGGSIPLGGLNDPSTATATNYYAFPAIDAESGTVEVRFTSDRGQTLNTFVDVDLSPLSALPPVASTTAKVTDGGVGVAAERLTPGAAVSIVRLSTSLVDVDQATLRSVEQGASSPQVTATVDGSPVPVVDIREEERDQDGSGIDVRLLGLPREGTLTLTLAWVPVSDPSAGENTVATGPWTLTIDLANPSGEPVAPQPTPTPVPTQTPVPTPTPTPVPTAPTFPADLYFAGVTPDGVLGLWVQPASGDAPRVVAQGNADLDAFWLVPGGKQVAVRFADDPAVYLAPLDGGALRKATMPDGRAVTEYVVSPDGTRIAYVPVDRQSLWVSNTDGRNLTQVHAVEIPEAQTIHGVSWAPRGYTLRYEVSQIAAGFRPFVATVGGPNETIEPVKHQLPREVLSYAWSPGGTELAYSTYNGIFRLRLSDGAETAITPAALREGPQRAIDALHWLPDGRLAFVVHEDSTVYTPADLWLMNADGSDAWRAVIGVGPVDVLRWTPDGAGFVAHVIDEPGLTWYPSIHDEPVKLAEDIKYGAYIQLDWTTN